MMKTTSRLLVIFAILALFVSRLAAQAPDETTPDYVGAYGAHNSRDPRAGNIGTANRWPGDTDSPWSMFLNPAFPWASGVTAETGPRLGRQSFSETLPDRSFFVDWAQIDPAELGAAATSLDPSAPYDSVSVDGGWTPKVWRIEKEGSAGEFWSYRRRIVVLPSGAMLTIFRPDSPPPTSHPGYPKDTVYQRDALWRIQAYQGHPYGFRRNPLAAKNPPVPYTETAPLYGWEIELPSAGTSTTSYVKTAGVKWIRIQGGEYQALAKGMTVVVIQFSSGFRYIPMQVPQLIEAGRWLGGSEYEKAPVFHRNILTGGSIQGLMAIIALQHMPWLFQGGIANAAHMDFYGGAEWHNVKEFWDNQRLGHYRSTFINCGDSTSPYFLSTFADMSRGYLGRSFISDSSGKGRADLAGLGLFATGLGESARDIKLYVPMTLFRGDEDGAFNSFYDEDIEAGIASRKTGLAVNGASHTWRGSIKDYRIPGRAHGPGNKNWHNDYRPGGISLLSELENRLNAEPGYPIPFQVFAQTEGAASPSATNADVPWRAEAIEKGAPILDYHKTEQFLKRDNSRWPSYTNTASGFKFLRRLGTDDQTAAWKNFESLPGLGASGTLAVANMDANDDFEVIGATAQGEVAVLRLVTNTSGKAGLVEEVRLVAKYRFSDYLSPSEIVLVSPKEKGGDWNAVVLSHLDTLYRVNLSSGVVTKLINNDVGPNQPPPIGRYLRGLKAGPGANEVSFVNGEGELIVADHSEPNRFTKNFVEGGLGPILPLTKDGVSDGFVYSSPDGNIKRIRRGIPKHPRNEQDISPFLFSYPGNLLKLPIAEAGYLAQSEYLVFLKDNLDLLGSPPTGGMTMRQGVFDLGNREPDGLVLVEPESTALPLHLIAYGDGHDAPNDFDTFLREKVYQFSVSPKDPSITHESYVHPPGPVGAIIPAPPGLKGRPLNGPNFPVKWIASLHSGQIALIGDLAGSEDLTGTHLAVHREPYANAFGWVMSDDVDSLLLTQGFIAMGVQGRSWKFDNVDDQPTFSTNAPNRPASVFTPEGAGMTNFFPSRYLHRISPTRLPSPSWQWGPARGACGVSTEKSDLLLYGFPDGGDAFGKTDPGYPDDLIAMPYLITNRQDVDKNMGHLVVMEASNLPYLPALNFFRDGKDPLTHEPIIAWSSIEISAGTGIGTPRQTSANLDGFGHNVQWADIDANGSKDLVAVTVGGRAFWWKNGAAPGKPPRLESEPTGRLPIDAALQAELGWGGDLGWQCMGLTTVQLDDDPELEILVGTTLDNNPNHPEHYTMGGSVHLLDVNTTTGELSVVTSHPADFGVAGIHPFMVDDDQYVALGTGRGRVHILHFDNGAFTRVFESEFFAPWVGAYNSLHSFPISSDNGRHARRFVFSSSGGIFGFDASFPSEFGAL